MATKISGINPKKPLLDPVSIAGRSFAESLMAVGEKKANIPMRHIIKKRI